MTPDIFSKQELPTAPLLFLAPMEGVTSYEFRETLCAFAPPDFVATEFIRITGERHTVRSLRRHNQSRLQIQFMAADEKVLQKSILHLKTKGTLKDTDWLDLNVGCPSRRVNSRGAGAALLLEPARLLSFLHSLRSVHPGPLSMKTRIGYQGDEDFPALLNHLSDAPIDFITIHARSKCAHYSGPIHYDCLRLAVETLPFPVIGNGDIWSREDAQAMIDATGVRGLMCGRGVIRNPFLFREIRGGAQPTRQELARFLFSLLTAFQAAPRRYVGRFKEFAGWFSQNELIGRPYFELVKRLESLSDVEEASRAYFKEGVTRSSKKRLSAEEEGFYG